MKRILNRGATDQIRTWPGKRLSKELSSVDVRTIRILPELPIQFSTSDPGIERTF